ncbi:hypothetical protein, partial [Vibrio vulnificus]|uniref:hypothetical protein n=1 Tax=Vibrio vulnificus TaxID=672 RepID=UPI001A075D31
MGQYTYDFWGDLATLVNPQGTYVYNTDNANQLTQVNFFLPGQTTGVVYEKLAYDANGSLTSRTIGNGTPSGYN